MPYRPRRLVAVVTLAFGVSVLVPLTTLAASVATASPAGAVTAVDAKRAEAREIEEQINTNGDKISRPRRAVQRGRLARAAGRHQAHRRGGPHHRGRVAVQQGSRPGGRPGRRPLQQVLRATSAGAQRGQLLRAEQPHEVRVDRQRP